MRHKLFCLHDFVLSLFQHSFGSFSRSLTFSKKRYFEIVTIISNHRFHIFSIRLNVFEITLASMTKLLIICRLWYLQIWYLQIFGCVTYRATSKRETACTITLYFHLERKRPRRQCQWECMHCLCSSFASYHFAQCYDKTLHSNSNLLSSLKIAITSQREAG